MAYGARQLAFFADPIDADFIQFHHANKWVYDALVRLAREWKAAGNDRCSISLLTEIVRWEVGTGRKSAYPQGLLASRNEIYSPVTRDSGTDSDENRSENVRETCADFKVNNNFRSRYARLIMASEPDLADLFVTRQLHASDVA